MTTVNQTLHHGGTFRLACDPAWPLTGMWPEVDALAAEHHAAVQAYEEAVANAPQKPSLADYDRACRNAIAAGHDLPEPPVSPTDDEIDAGAVQVGIAHERVLRTATAIIDTIRDNREALADAPTIRGPIREAEDRIRDLQAEIEAVHRVKASYDRIPMWLHFNAERPWMDPNPDEYPDPAEVAFSERLRSVNG